MSTLIKLRRGTAAEWSSNGSTVLASGEPAYEIDTGRLKIGDGFTAWSGLYYVSIVPTGFISGSGINISIGSNGSTASISTTGVSFSGHTHTTSDISDFNSSVSGLLPSVTGTGYVSSTFANNIYTIQVTGLQPSGSYASGIHTHVSSDITDFNSSVSGLITIQSISAGSGISVTATTGNYTIAVSGLNSSYISDFNEAVDDRIGSGLLTAGTGVSISYNDPSGTLTIDNLHTEINIFSKEPQGFVNRLDSLISFNDTTRTFTIQPSGTSYHIYIEGTKVSKTGVETIVIGTGTALNYIHFDTDTGLLSNKNTAFNFDTDVPIAYIHWNGDISQSTFFGEERHGIRMDSVTHKWIHNTFGIQYISGLSIGGYTLLGNGTSNTHAQISISDGILYQEDIIIDIVDGNNGVEFTQQLDPIAYIPTYYHSGSSGQWVRDSGTAFPIKYNGTRAQYNLYSGGTWTTPNVTNNRYFAMWIVATNDINDPILAIVGQREDSSLLSAENNNTWSSINLANIPASEIKPLYRLIFVTNDTFTNTPKSSLQSILDLRESVSSTINGVTQNDHGLLFGLGDDDHSQYVHIDTARTITANHTFSNGLTISSGLLSAASGNFTSLTVNGTGVSISGHTHTSSNITDFNSSVSGLLPTVTGTGYVSSSFNSNIYTISVTGLQPSGNYSLVGHTHISSDITDFTESVQDVVGASGFLVGQSGITISYNDVSNTLTISSSGSGGGATISNAGDNRILTSDGTSTGINGESNLTFDGSLLSSSGSGLFTSGINVGGSAVTGLITGLSTTSSVPSIRFQSITANHANSSHVIFDWYKNLSTRLFYVDGAGSLYADSNNGNFIAPSTSPNTGNGAYIGNGMRRATTNVGMDFTWGESITSATEPGLDLYPISGTHIASGILLRLSKNSSKTDVAMLVNGSGFLGLGTTSPTARLHVIGTGTVSGLLNIDNLRLDGNILSSTNTNGDIDLTPNGTGEVNITKVDINSGTIDGTVIGLSAASSGKFTQIYPTVGSGTIVSSAVDTDASTGQIFDITLTQNITLNNPTNSVDGVTIRWRIQQDGSGGRTVALDTKFQIPSSASNPLPWSTGANVMDTLAATYHAGRDKWDVVAFVPGY